MFHTPNGDQYYGYEPVDGEAAEIIAGIAAKNAGATICPLIRECHRGCMSIVNLYPENDDSIARKLSAALDIVQGNQPPNERHEEFGVGIQCDRHPAHNTPFEVLSLPRSLLKREEYSIEQRFNQLCAYLDSQKPQS